jgi:hypothetical protein
VRTRIAVDRTFVNILIAVDARVASRTGALVFAVDRICVTNGALYTVRVGQSDGARIPVGTVSPCTHRPSGTTIPSCQTDTHK